MTKFTLVRHAALAALTLITSAVRALPPVPTPAENPTTEQKRILGKILFFDEQFSTSNRVACASCHVLPRAGADPRNSPPNPGIDGVAPSPDDIFGSPGIIAADANNDYVRSLLFTINPQVTGRSAPSVINAAFAIDTFWDGRARTTFTDPQTGQVAIATGGGLESQSVGPPVSNVEMSHAGTDWNLIIAKLGSVRPLDLATSHPADVSAALAGHPDYPELFRRAFGDTSITSRRIAFAIAAYERTLIADQTPFDAFRAGNTAALSPGQTAGLGTFQQVCVACHAIGNPLTGDLTSDETFRNIGLRPIAEDNGRQTVTGVATDAGRFKVPQLRNIGLKARFMHNGQFNNIGAVVGFYGAPPPFPQNVDPARVGPQGQGLAVGPPGSPQRNGLIDFLTNSLTDPRVAAQQPPFDKPTLFGERPASQNTVVQGGGLAGTGGVTPAIIAENPPMLGSLDFRVGIDGALLGAQATLAYSFTDPLTGPITPQFTAGVVTTTNNGNGRGIATFHWNLKPESFSSGQTVFAQWFVADAGAAGGTARSNVVRIPIFCGSGGCPVPCGYANCDGSTVSPFLNVGDFSCFLAKYALGDPYANCDQSTVAPAINVSDFTCYLQKYAAGCP